MGVTKKQQLNAVVVAIALVPVIATAQQFLPAAPVGAPGWTNTVRYSITAKAPEGTPPTAMSVMMPNPLKDRFRLTTHLETREQPIFNLVIARTDGRLGPDLTATPAECQATIAERTAAAKAAAERGASPPLPTCL